MDSAGTSFKMSDTTRGHIVASLDGLSEVQKCQVLSAVADLLTEAEIHIRRVAQGDIRKMWAEALATMFMVTPTPAPKAR